MLILFLLLKGGIFIEMCMDDGFKPIIQHVCIDIQGRNIHKHLECVDFYILTFFSKKK